MNKCRICLYLKKNLCSIFEMDHDISYADMITSIAKVKIVEDSHKNSICLQCRRKLRSLYNFKEEIERSDVELNRELKIFRFNNIDDVKIQLLREIEEEDKNIIHTDVSCNSLLQSGCSFMYGNITIAKITPYQNSTKQKNEVLTFSNPGINKYDIDYDYVDHYDSLNTRGHEVTGRKRVIKKQREGSDKDLKRTSKYTSKLKKVSIKPIVLNNITVKPFRKKSNIIQKHMKRRDMCPYCGIMSSNMKTHLMVHIGEKNFKCSECSKAFFTSKQLSYHHQGAHLKAGAFRCAHCVAVFNNKASLQSHMVSHTDDKKYICLVCNKAFKRKNSLQRHKLIHSSLAKSVKCELCNMSFLYKQGLRHHMRVHTGERPFNCEICSQPYSYKHDFNRHCLKKHGVFLKQRSVYVMNEEVLIQERALMKGLMLRIQGVVKEGEPLNPFQGPHAVSAFNQAVKALGSCQIPIDVL